MKMFFDDLDAAIEEAKFCAESEKRKYIIKPKYKGFEVFPKTRRGGIKPRNTEVGFKEETPVDAPRSEWVLGEERPADWPEPEYYK
jgi:hypothetical protein